jgi:hypothetical protein
MDEIISIRLTAIETRQAAIEARLSAIEQGSAAKAPRRRKELTMEERTAIRARLLAGQQAKRARELAAAVAQAQPTKAARGGKKEAKNGTSEATN